MTQPDRPGYREPSPPSATAPWNPRAARAFWLSAASVTLVPVLLGLIALTKVVSHPRAMTLVQALAVGVIIASFASLLLGIRGARAGLVRGAGRARDVLQGPPGRAARAEQRAHRPALRGGRDVPGGIALALTRVSACAASTAPSASRSLPTSRPCGGR